MNDDDQDPLGTSYQGKQPWFGPKRFGFGYGPRTWQGYLVTAILAGATILIATVAKHHHSSLSWLAALPIIVIPLAIIVFQRR
jgi:hypothetical protein